jgi:hypothetical protein
MVIFWCHCDGILHYMPSFEELDQLCSNYYLLTLFVGGNVMLCLSEELCKLISCHLL